MNGYQPFDATSEDGFGRVVSPSGTPPVIARMPDLDGSLYAGDIDQETEASELVTRRLSMPKIALAASVAVVVIIGGWMILGSGSGDNQSAQESWQPPPPAASAPEAPRWDADADSKTDAITLDEVMPRLTPSKTLPTAFEEAQVEKQDANETDEHGVKVVAKPPSTGILPRVAVNRPVVIGTPVPPVTSPAGEQDWSTMSEAEYYRAVRQRSGGEVNARSRQHGNETVDNFRSPSAVQNGLVFQESSPVSSSTDQSRSTYQSRPVYRTTSRPLSGYHDSDIAARQTDADVSNSTVAPQSTGAARLNGTIEPPTVRMY